MTNNPEVHITFDDNSEEVVIEVKNVQGPSCTELSKPFTDLFQVEAVTRKAEATTIQLKQQDNQEQKVG